MYSDLLPAMFWVITLAWGIKGVTVVKSKKNVGCFQEESLHVNTAAFAKGNTFVPLARSLRPDHDIIISDQPMKNILTALGVLLWLPPEAHRGMFNITVEESLLNRAAVNGKVAIDLDYTSPRNKAGWNLLFSEDFDGALDDRKWHRSNFIDGGNKRCDTAGITKNPSTVSVSNGQCQIAVTDLPYSGCNYSSGEIKSFSTMGDIEPYTFTDDGYLEMRAKLAISHGVGCAAWLYCFQKLNPGSYSEIDLFEVNGVDKHKFQTNYWYGSNPDQYPEIISVTKKGCTGDCKVDLTQNFVVYGLEWARDYIRYFVNGIVVREIRLDDPSCGPGIPGCGDCKLCGWAGKECCVYGQSPDRPYMIRFGTSRNTIGPPGTIEPEALPAHMSIDYIRVYKKQGQKAAPLIDVPSSVLSSEYFYPKAQYYPGVKYTWSCEAVTSFEPWPTGASVRATIDPNVSGNKVYPITMTAEFPDGYTETSIANIYITKEPPVDPSQSLIKD